MSGAEFIRYLERSSGVRLPQIRRLHNSLLSGGESPAAAAIEGGAKSRKTILRQRSEARRRQHRRKINQRFLRCVSWPGFGEDTPRSEIQPGDTEPGKEAQAP